MFHLDASIKLAMLHELPIDEPSVKAVADLHEVMEVFGSNDSLRYITDILPSFTGQAALLGSESPEAQHA